MEKKSKKFSAAARLNSFRYALQGIKKVFQYEHNFRIHMIIAFIVIISGVLLRINHLEWMLVIVCMGLVFTTEIINTAIENLVDWVAPQINEKAGAVKDISAAAVLVSSFIALVTGLLIFLPYIIRLGKRFM
jgi:undecaprenol kinase/diacylglycerol kinase (ATP)